MDENAVPEVFVRTPSGELRVLREWDFLEAVASGAIDEGKVSDYARGALIKVPSGYDARAAVELMSENNVLRLLVTEEGKDRIVTISDLAFESLKLISELTVKTTGFVLAKVQPGREGELATDYLIVNDIMSILVIMVALLCFSNFVLVLRSRLLLPFSMELFKLFLILLRRVEYVSSSTIPYYLCLKIIDKAHRVSPNNYLEQNYIRMTHKQNN
ncbi:MAG: hypothetical protein J7L82_03695 [Staphylothermus sp.]|nr:hypothetical protein [Staphylothermus sp.]